MATRPRISVFIATSLDGWIATDDDGLDWLTGAGAPDEDYGFGTFLADIDLVAMGRATYAVIEGFDELPYGTRPVHVFTNQALGPRPGFEFYARTPHDAVAHWSAQGIRHVYLDGGTLISEFLDVGLVDDFVVTVVPTLLGAGKPLFHRIATSTELRLTRSQAYPSGMVQLAYEVVR